jgi:hypothetical protein
MPDIMTTEVRALFERYEQFFRTSLAGSVDMDAVAALYASEFIAASPSGVKAGKNDAKLKETMEAGYARYRALGTKDMRIRDLGVTPLDEHHCVVHVAWTATYAKDGREIAVDFDVRYLVQRLDGQPKVFGWVTGDEQALLKEQGII